MADDNKLKVDETEEELVDEVEEELEDEQEDTDGSATQSGSAPDPEASIDTESEAEEVFGEIDNTKPFSMAERVNKSEKARHGQK